MNRFRIGLRERIGLGIFAAGFLFLLWQGYVR
jgi:hypothetical protein